MLSLWRVCKDVERNAVRHMSSQASLSTPWFVDNSARPQPPHFTSTSRTAQASKLPEDLPEHIIALHDALCKSPHLAQGGVDVRPPPTTYPGPPLLEEQKPKGRRRRGGTTVGTGVPDASSGPWRWVVLAEVRQLLLSSSPFTSGVY